MIGLKSVRLTAKPIRARKPKLFRVCHRLLPFAILGALCALVEMTAPVALAASIQASCESRYDGITYCVEDGGDIHVVIIDLDHPHIRFEMVMADDVSTVGTTHRERIEDIVGRPPYRDQGPTVAVNADYFGHQHGPEGLTIKNGRRMDGERGRVFNPHAVWRSSLAISRLNNVSLGRKSAEELDDPRVYSERFFNAVGGGPLILNYGVVIPNVVACPLERFPVGACRRRIQTAAGLSQDGRWLYLAVGEGRDIEGFARLLRDYGAFTAIKLDGGGSSQLWYDGRMRHDTDRAVGNALLVFHSSVPRHDARFIGRSDLAIVEPGARSEISFEIENTGFLDWEPILGYRFKNVQGWPVLGPAYWRLSSPVPAGDSLSSSRMVVAPQCPGVYEAEWQLVRRSEAIGSRLRFGLVVLPSGSAETGFKEQVEQLLSTRLSGEQFAEEWLALRQEIEQEILNEMEHKLRLAAGDDARFNGLLQDIVHACWQPLLRQLPW